MHHAGVNDGVSRYRGREIKRYEHKATVLSGYRESVWQMFQICSYFTHPIDWGPYTKDQCSMEQRTEIHEGSRVSNFQNTSRSFRARANARTSRAFRNIRRVLKARKGQWKRLSNGQVDDEGAAHTYRSRGRRQIRECTQIRLDLDRVEFPAKFKKFIRALRGDLGSTLKPFFSLARSLPSRSLARPFWWPFLFLTLSRLVWALVTKGAISSLFRVLKVSLSGARNEMFESYSHLWIRNAASTSHAH